MVVYHPLSIDCSHYWYSQSIGVFSETLSDKRLIQKFVKVRDWAFPNILPGQRHSYHDIERDGLFVGTVVGLSEDGKDIMITLVEEKSGVQLTVSLGSTEPYP